MKKKVFIILLIMIPILVVTLFYLIGMESRPVSGDVSNGKTGSLNTPTITVTPTPVVPPTIAELMTALDSTTQKVADERILLLTEQENALGYYSNILLAYRYDGKGLDASTYYQAALNLYYTKNVHFNFALHLKESGKLEDAENEYLQLLPEDAALQALTELNTQPLKIGGAYINKRQWKAAEEILAPLVENINSGGNTSSNNTDGSTSNDNTGDNNANNDNTNSTNNITSPNSTLISYYAQALVGQNDLKRALPYYKRLYEMDTENSNIAWWYARCLEAAGQSSSAAQIYSSIGEKGAYRRGLILQNSGQTMKAAEVLNSSNEAVSKWRAARIWDAAGMVDKAIEAYAHIAESTSSYQDDAAYRAYILASRQSNSQAQYELQHVKDVLAQHPAWMERVGQEPVFQQLEKIYYDKPDFLIKAEEYEKDGYADAALIEVAIGSKDTNLQEKLALGDWYLEREEYYNAVLWGIRSISDAPTIKGYELSYPRAFEEFVTVEAQKYNLEPELIWAVAREESHFRYDAVSSAGALGLMQIMPPTGKDIAQRLGVNITNDDLLNPEIAVKFGSFYINSMLNMFDRDIDKAMAAYNGGGGNVQRWMQSSFGTSDEDFPTAITFPETQEYITKVKNSYLIYKWLY